LIAFFTNKIQKEPVIFIIIDKLELNPWKKSKGFKQLMVVRYTNFFSLW